MSMHFGKLGNFSELIAKHGTNYGKWNTDDGAMYTLRSTILHLADISNQAKPIGIAHMWAVRILKEFFSQGDREKSVGLPVSPLCDRSQIDISGSQVGFIDFIVRPSYELFAAVIPASKSKCLPEVARNRDNWKKTILTIEDV